MRQQPHLDQAWVAIFVEHDVPIAALERVECKVYLMDGEIGYTAGSEDDDLISLISAAYFSLPRGGGPRVGADSSGRQAGMPESLVRSLPTTALQALLKATCATTQTP